MDKVLIDSVRQPGRTKLVAPVFADILVKLKLYRRADLVAKGAQTSPPSEPSATKPRKAREYKRRDMQAEE